MTSTWTRLRTWLAEHAPPLHESLRGGLPSAELAELETALGVELPQDVRASLRTCNGQDAQASGVVEGHRLLGDFEIVEAWTSLVGLDAEGALPEPDSASPAVQARAFHRRWIPIAEQEPGSYVCVDLAPTDFGVHGQLIGVWSGDRRRQVVAASLGAWLARSVSDKEAGNEVYDATFGNLVDRHEASERSEALNWRELAWGLHRAGQTADAAALAVSAIDWLTCTSAERPDLKAWAEQRLGRVPRLDNARLATPGSEPGDWALVDWARIASKCGEHDHAVQAARSTGHLGLIAQVLREAERYDEAIVALADIEDPDLMHLRAAIRADAGDPEGALTDRIRADRFGGWHESFGQLRTEGDAHEREVAIHAFLEKYPADQRPWVHAGALVELVRVLIDLDRRDEAATVARHPVFERVPEQAEPLAGLLTAEEDPVARLRAALQEARASESEAEEATIRAELGLLLVDDAPEEAWDHLERAVMVLPGSHTLSKRAFEALDVLDARGFAR